MKKMYVMALVAIVAFAAEVNAQEQAEEINFSKENFAGQKAQTVEAEKTVADGVMTFTVSVDHKKDGKGNADGKHLKGWPRIYYDIKPSIDLSKFKELTFEYKVTSTQPADKKTKIYIYFKSGDLKCTYGFEVNREDKWHKKIILIKDFVARSKKPAAEWNNASRFQFGAAESHYADGVKLNIQLKNIILKQEKQ